MTSERHPLAPGLALALALWLLAAFFGSHAAQVVTTILLALVTGGQVAYSTVGLLRDLQVRD